MVSVEDEMKRYHEIQDRFIKLYIEQRAEPGDNKAREFAKKELMKDPTIQGKDLEDNVFR